MSPRKVLGVSRSTRALCTCKEEVFQAKPDCVGRIVLSSTYSNQVAYQSGEIKPDNVSKGVCYAIYPLNPCLPIEDTFQIS